MVYDVGGGSGIYATWLAVESLGWAVRDLDAAWDDPARRELVPDANGRGKPDILMGKSVG